MSGLELRSFRWHQLGPVDLTIAPGELVGLSGPSGSGKTLLLRALADLDEHAGELSLNGQACHNMTAPDWRKQVGLLAADSAWWHDHVGPHFESTANQQFARLGFPGDVMDWEIARLSSGERQRLSLLRLLENQPQILLLDEPTANLDAATTTQVEQLIRDYVNTHNAGVLWVSHDPAQLQRMTSRQFVLNNNLQEVA